MVWTYARWRKFIGSYAFLAASALLVVVVIAVGMFFGTRMVIGERGPHNLRVVVETFGAEVFDPSMDSFTGLYLHSHMFDYMLGMGSNGKQDINLGALSRWESKPNGKEVELVLKEGMRWHDGNIVTSEDIQFSVEHYMRRDSSCAACPGLKRDVNDIELIDNLSARIRLKVPDIVFIARFGPLEADMPLLPKHHFEKVGTVTFNKEPLGSGPWKFRSHVKGEFAEFETNLNYWNHERVPIINVLKLHQVSEEDSRIAMLQTGVVDIVPIGPGNVEKLKGQGFQIKGPKNIISTTIRFLMSYDQSFLTYHLDFRKALIYGTDLALNISTIYPEESATVARGSALFRPFTPGYDTELEEYPYEPEIAKRLLDGVGYDGETIQLYSLPAYGLMKLPQINEMIARDWRRIGLQVDVIEIDWISLAAKMQSRPQWFDDPKIISMFQGAAPVRPRAVLDQMRRYMTDADGAILAYSDIEKGNKIFSEINGTSSESERETLLKKLNREMYDEFWAIPVLWSHDTYAISPDLKGWLPTDGVSTDLHFETIRGR